MTFDLLTEQLLLLADGFAQARIPLIIGGGMGLYVRDVHVLPASCSARYGTKRPTPRTTSDLDVLLSADVIISMSAMHDVRDLLEELEYEPVARYFQFVKEHDGGRKTKVDLLAAQPEDLSLVKVTMGHGRAAPHHGKPLVVTPVGELHDPRRQRARQW